MSQYVVKVDGGYLNQEGFVYMEPKLAHLCDSVSTAARLIWKRGRMALPEAGDISIVEVEPVPAVPWREKRIL